MKKDIKVVVFANDSCAYDLPGNPTKFIEWWEEKFSLCQPEYKERLKIDCSATNYYDCSHFEVEIYYYRPETDEEYENRLKKEQQAREFIENQELCELERLKKKYGV